MTTLEERIAFNDNNPEARCACALVLDTSGSMAGPRIEELNAGLVSLKSDILGDPIAAMRVELGIITFDSEVKVVRDFAPVVDFEPPALTAQYQTFTATAILTALEKLEERKAYYKKEGLPYFRPWLFLITDGRPEGEPPEKLQEAKERLALAQSNNHVKVFAVGVGDDVDLATIEAITGTKAVRLKGAEFKKLFAWLSTSMKKVSSGKPGAQTKLPSINDWAES